MKKIINNDKFIKVLMAIISYYAVCKLEIIKVYDFISFIIFGIFIYFYSKSDLKKYKKYNLIISIILSFLYVYGSILYKYKDSSTIDSFKVLLSVNSVINLIGIFNLLFVSFSYILPKLFNLIIKENKINISNKKLFIISFLVILICWIPYFLMYYPGTLSVDSFYELKIIINNFSNISDHHPIMHVLFISIPFNIGYKLFKSMTLGIALTTIFQMIIMSLIYSYSVLFVKKRCNNKKVVIVMVLLYALLPVFGFYSIVMWKDVIFSGLLLLLTIESIKILEKETHLKMNNMISFIIVSILCIFFRNNAIYLYFIYALITLILFRKQIKYFLICFMIIFSSYFIIKGPIYNVFNIEKSSSSEYIAIPLQQIGRMAYKNIKFNDYEKNEINKIIKIDKLKKIYNPVIVDDIKFSKYYNSNEFDKNKIKYLKIYLGLICKHPITAVEGYLTSTLGYFHTDVVYWSVLREINDNDYNIKIDSKLPSISNKYFNYIQNKWTPIINIQWSIALCFYILFIFSIISKKIRGIKGIYPYIPVFGLWITMMVAAPVYAEFRYVFGAYTSLIILMLFPYLKLNYKTK